MRYYEIVFAIGTDDHDVAEEISDIMFTNYMEGLLESDAPTLEMVVTWRLIDSDTDPTLVNGKTLDALIDGLGPASEDVVAMAEEEFGRLVL